MRKESDVLQHESDSKRRVSEESMSLTGERDTVQRKCAVNTLMLVPRECLRWPQNEPRSFLKREIDSRSCATKCLKCEAYKLHCKAASEMYRKTLKKYTKTVSELMMGFRKV